MFYQKCHYTHKHTHKCHHICQFILKETTRQISAKRWKLLPDRILLTEMFIILLSVLFKKEFTHTHTPGKFFSDYSFIVILFFPFSELLACFYLRDAVIYITDLVSIFPLVPVKCRAKSNHCIACTLLTFVYFTLCFILFL